MRPTHVRIKSISGKSLQQIHSNNFLVLKLAQNHNFMNISFLGFKSEFYLFFVLPQFINLNFCLHKIL